VKNFRDWGIPLGRRFRALKLWFLIKDQGVAGLQARMRRDLEWAQWFRAQVDQAPDWERLAPVPLQTVCIRHRPAGMAGEDDLRRHNLAIAERINDSGQFYLTPAELKGVQMIRVSIGSQASSLGHVERLWAALRQTAEGL
jgi:aromatic-L-amino-acid decarboxylase